jgi:hypothetical protein
MQTRNVFLCAFATAVSLVAGDVPGNLPYAGTWKMNPAKSDFGGSTVTYEKMPSGEWQATADGVTYKFKMDGKDYADGMGQTAAWKSVDAATWQTDWKLNGKVLVTDTLRLSDNGESLTVNTKGAKPNGEGIDQTVTFARVSGESGLGGKWKSTRLESSSPSVVELIPSGPDGLTFREPAMKLSCEGKLDGQDYSCTGPTLPPGWTVAMTKAGERSLDLLVKKDGKEFYRVRYTVDEDGQCLTESGGATATGEKVTVVYDRQPNDQQRSDEQLFDDQLFDQ